MQTIQTFRTQSVLFVLVPMAILFLMSCWLSFAQGDPEFAVFRTLLLVPFLVWFARLRVHLREDVRTYRTLLPTHEVVLSQVSHVEVHWRQPRRPLAIATYGLHVGGHIVSLNTAGFGPGCHQAIFARLPRGVRESVDRDVEASAA